MASTALRHGSGKPHRSMSHLHLIVWGQLQVHAAVPIASAARALSGPAAPLFFSPSLRPPSLFSAPLSGYLTPSFSLLLLPHQQGFTSASGGLSSLSLRQGKLAPLGLRSLLALGQGRLSSPLNHLSALSRGHLLSFQCSRSFLRLSLLFRC